MNTPVSPKDVFKPLPEFVIEAVNELIRENYKRSGFELTVSEVKSRIISMMLDDTKFNANWLDIEDTYRNYGWNVKFDKPGYNETYESHYKFSH